LTLAALSGLLAVGMAGGACGDSGSDGGGGSGGGEGLSNPGRICIDRTSLAAVPPAGLKLGFRVLDAYGDPVRPLDTATEGDVTILNDEKGTPFGQGMEGGSVSDVGQNQEIELYSVLALDMSDSIFNAGLQGQVLDGAEAFVQEVVQNAAPQFRHNVAILVFGRPDLIEVVQGFTDDAGLLFGALDDLRSSPSRGTTDLYEAYIEGLAMLEAEGDPDAVVERFLVLITDGTHEAGAEGYLRELALATKADSDANKYTVGIRGAYDACRLEELSGGPPTCAGELLGCREGINCDPNNPPPSSCTQFIPDVDPAAVAEAFRAIALRADGIAKSNYVVGVCTPVALGSSSVTIQVDVDGAVDTATLPYIPSELGLNGAVNECNAEEVKNTDVTATGGGGMGGGGMGGGGAGGGGTGGAGGAGGG
jgi:hypothetical protein